MRPLDDLVRPLGVLVRPLGDLTGQGKQLTLTVLQTTSKGCRLSELLCKTQQGMAAQLADFTIRLWLESRVNSQTT